MTLPAGDISLRNVSKSYTDGAESRPVLRHFDLHVAAGETVALCGPSGSGKSTVLNLIAGVLPADAGEIHVGVGGPTIAVHGLSVAAATRYRRDHVGYVFQFFNLVPTLTVAENVQLPLKLTGRSADWPESLTRLRELGLADRLDAFPDNLSGGERQRVAIARALAHDPKLLLADEPTGNLDVTNTTLVADLLFDAARAAGKTLLIATHNPDIAARADRRVDLS